MDYTDAHKGQELREFVPWSEVIYMKRAFQMRDGYMYAPLEQKSIQEMCNWVRKTRFYSIAESTKLNVETAMMEWVHYGKKEYDLQAKSLARACRSVNIPTVIPTYKHADTQLKQDGYLLKSTDELPETLEGFSSSPEEDVFTS